MNKSYISFKKACDLIKKGKLVAIPTETVYGLGACALNKSAIKQIFKIKKRPFFNPLIIHCANPKQLNCFHKDKHPILDKLMKKFCPGPITFILKKNTFVYPMITAGQNKVGLRIPKHSLTLKLIEKTFPLCAPSANFYGKLSPTSAEHVKSIFKNQIPILDGGPCKIGIESTVLEPDFTKNILRILRPGSISQEELKQWLKKNHFSKWKVQVSRSILSPGQDKNHYQPCVPLIIIDLQNKELLPKIAEIKNHLSQLFPNRTFKQLKLSSSAILTARTLYSKINTLSQKPFHVIFCIRKKPVPSDWKAIWNRLEKASIRKVKWKKK